MVRTSASDPRPTLARFKGIDLDVGHHHLGSLSQQGAGERQPDARCRTGDHRNLAQ
jgi:hypothetical protein